MTHPTATTVMISQSRTAIAKRGNAPHRHHPSGPPGQLPGTAPTMTPGRARHRCHHGAHTCARSLPQRDRHGGHMRQGHQAMLHRHSGRCDPGWRHNGPLPAAARADRPCRRDTSSAAPAGMMVFRRWGCAAGTARAAMDPTSMIRARGPDRTGGAAADLAPRVTRTTGTHKPQRVRTTTPGFGQRANTPNTSSPRA